MYTEYNNILSKDEYNKCKSIINSSKWEYGHASTKNSIYKFWILNLSNDIFFNTIFFQKIKKITKNNFEIIKIHANGHTFGQEGDWHTDSLGENEWTFLYYFNEGDSSCIGETYFIDDEKNTKSSIPIHNSAVLFKSNILHKGSSPKITFNDLRITIAFKLKKIENINNTKIF